MLNIRYIKNELDRKIVTVLNAKEEYKYHKIAIKICNMYLYRRNTKE